MGLKTKVFLEAEALGSTVTKPIVTRISAIDFIFKEILIVCVFSLIITIGAAIYRALFNYRD